MRVVKDIISGDEMASDNFHVCEVDDMFYKFKCCLVNKHDNEGEINIGANPSADDEPQQQTSAPGEAPELILDVVKNHQLESTQFGTKKSFKLYLREFLGSLLPKLTPERQTFLRTNLEKMMTEHVYEHFNDCEFFIGKNWSGGVGICREIDGQRYMFILKDAVVWEKF